MTHTNLSMKHKQTHRHRKWTSVCQEGGRSGGGMEWEFGVSRSKLLYIGWINKVLVYSKGNYIQYPVINHNAREY